MTHSFANAAHAGTFTIGGDLAIHRLGFGAMRITGPGIWGPPADHDEAIRTLRRLRNLGVEQIDLWQLHRIDPKVPADEQFDAVRSFIDQKLIRHAGLSEVSVDDIKAASKFFDVATVQNRYNLVDRTSEDVLDYCTAQNIGFIPWFPLAAGDLAKPGSILDIMAGKYGAHPSQIALAWILKRSPVMLPIPGTSKVAHLEQNVAAASITLSDEDFAALDSEGRKAFQSTP
ncbi:aldo/keto reductase (plasmid) [Komagataeibacter sucrofermentans]|uniref:NADP-dependent oxidoreductase domain-containing protein n=1 Tax=Komagataeibacter sucrofermentans TaxID=1053551 RepID=A0A318QYV3_9PROT|nr:aldo/keto reductase [Komagataeibacter sucrofermentans]PYD78233.1 hypothetical protein CFR77_11860 [Komagataeibacter sucrofermentans]GBQ52849.1 aldo/keto reductase [Komagataeibacter sucrofermentans DSM 15973]